MIFNLIAVLFAGIILYEIIKMIIMYSKYKNLFPSDLFLSGLFEYDELLGYNLCKSFKSEDLWNGSKKVRKKLGIFQKGMDKKVTINSDRYRGKLLSLEKKSNIYRIIVIGDSLAFCPWNDNKHTWPNNLEIELNKIQNGIQKFEVINLGVGGHDLYQTVERYSRDYSKYDGDLILNCCFIIDWKYGLYLEKAGGKYEGDPFNCKTKNKRYFYQAWKSSILNYSLAKLKIIINKLNSKQMSPQFVREFDDHSINLNYYRKYYSPDNFWINNYIKNFDKLYNTIKNNLPEAKLCSVSFPVLLSNPSFYNDPDNYFLPDPLSLNMNMKGYDSKEINTIEHHAKYLAHSLIFKDFLVNLSEKYEDCDVIAENNSINNFPMENRDEIFVDDFHLNNYGSKIFANDLAKYIIKNVV